MEYKFKAKDKEGQSASGIVEAENPKQAEASIRDRGFSEITLTVSAKPSLLATSFNFLERVKVKDMVIFARQLSVMEGAKVPLTQSLQTIARETVNKKLKATLISVADEVEAGTRFSLALSKHDDIFSDFYINMVRSGETTGRLDEVLNYLADQQEKDYDLISKIRGAMMYPAFIIIGMIVVGTIMMIFVIPRLTDIFKESGGELPLPTRILIGTSDFLVNFWWLVLALFILGFIIFREWIKTVSGRRLWDGLKIKIPIFGFLFQRIYLVRFSRSLTTLLSGGVDMVPALLVAADIVGNASYKDIILKTKKEVEDGNSLNSVFRGRKEVPVMFSQMLAVGEETGKISEVLSRLTTFYAREIDNFVANLSTIIEPVIMLVLGGAVGLMVAAIILPMYSLATQF